MASPCTDITRSLTNLARHGGRPLDDLADGPVRLAHPHGACTDDIGLLLLRSR
ncbi:hypothetical protein ACIRD2_09580 [Streptomyces sp. NPDC093595]|uniref:hypothetical protein n=1 Tax=Streptomyces sp. NPDC093595 TaxID=3366045 RepID=UPI00381179EC